MIRREDVADLQPGDVVELFRNGWPDGTVVRGALYEAYDWLYVAEQVVRGDGGQPALGPSYTLTVVSRAPRPLYVNHPRTESVPGDVVRAGKGGAAVIVCNHGPNLWEHTAGGGWWGGLPEPLRLLVDGSTGEVVP